MTSEITEIENEKIPTSLKYRALILTAIPLEYNAIREHLIIIGTKKHPSGNIFEIGKITLDGTDWEICLGQTGQHNIAAAIETERGITLFNPHIAMFVGIAGRIKDLQIGDIVIPSKVYPNEYGKIEEDEGFKPRSDTRSPNFQIIKLATFLSKGNVWKKRLKTPQENFNPRVVIGPIVSGEKVIGNDTSYEFDLIKKYYSDAIAVEMEGYGFLDATYKNNNLDAVIIRVISDLCKGKNESDSEGNQEIVISFASAFAFEFLAGYSKHILQNKQKISTFDIAEEIPIIPDSQNQNQEQLHFDSVEKSDQQKETSSLKVADTSEKAVYTEEIDEIKHLIDTHRPEKALLAIASFKSKNWDSATNFEKYRIISNEGLAEIQLTENEKGGALLIEALALNSDDVKALENAAVGYLLTERYEEAIEYANKAIDKTSNSPRAYSVIIQSKAHFEPIEDIIPTIPEEIINFEEVAGAIGQCYSISGNFIESTRWFSIAVKDAKLDALSFKVNYASSLLNKVKNDKRSLSGLQINKELNQDLEKSQILFDEVLNLISQDKSMQKAHIGWLIERGIVKRTMGLINKSSEDFNEAFNLNSTSPVATYYKCLADFESGKFYETEVLCEKILWEKSTPGSLWLYLNSLRSQKKYDEGIAKISEFEKKISTKDQEDLINQFLLIFYLDKGEKYFENAESIAIARYYSDKSEISRAIDLLKVYRISKKLAELEKIIGELKDEDLSTISDLQQIDLADIFYDMKQYNEASKIYSRLVDPSVNTNLTRKLILSLFFIENHKQALECCKILHLHCGSQSYSSRIELTIYHEVGDLVEAKKLCNRYLEVYPDDYEMKLSQAIVNIRANNTSAVISFLEIPYNYDNLSYESGSKLVNLFFDVSRYDDAIRLSYFLRNKFLENPQTHLDYIRIILDVADRSSLLNKPEKVAIDDIVQLEDSFTKITSYLVCSDNCSIDQNIAIKLSLASPLGKKIIGVSEGGKINFNTPVGENFVIVRNILSKYVFAFQESVNNFSQQFIGHPGIFRIPIGSGNEGYITDKDIQNIRTLVEKNQKNVDTVLNFYKKRLLTISGIAQQLNRNIFTVCSIISQNVETGFIYRNNNSPKDEEELFSRLRNHAKLIVDPISLYTLSTTNIGPLLVNKYGKIGIAQSTLDLLQAFIFSLSGISSQGYMSLGITNNTLTGYQISSDQISTTKKHYENFLQWLKENCEILPCYESLSIDPDKKREYYSIIGQASHDTILLASQENSLLYSDDGLIQSIANELYHVKSVWTQFLLSDLSLENENIKTKLDEAAITLLRNHYYPPVINSEILFIAAKKAHWEDISPLTEILQIIGDSRLNLNYSIRVGADFVIKLWLQRVDNNSRKYLLLKVLRTIAIQRDNFFICLLFARYIELSFELFDEEKNEIFVIINLYLNLICNLN